MLGEEDTEKGATGRKDVNMLMGQGAKKRTHTQHVQRREGTGHAMQPEPRAARGRRP